MANSSIIRWILVVSGLALLAGCARWRGRAPALAPPSLTSFDDLLPGNITGFIYLPDLPAAQKRFRTTHLWQRLSDQKARGLWKRIEFLRPWVAAAYEQITEQVNELAWGQYRAGDRRQWFLIARVRSPARQVLSRLHKRTLPRIAEHIPSPKLVRRRFLGQRVFEWVAPRDGAEHLIVCYAMLGQLLVMGSDRELVQQAIERRPAWWRRLGHSHPRDPASDSGDPLQALRLDYQRGDDLYAWFRAEAEKAETEQSAASRLGRLAARLRKAVASRVESASAGFAITPPEITGRWRLALAGPPRDLPDARTIINFTSLIPDSVQTCLVIHRLPADHPLFDTLREILAEAIASGPFERLIERLRLVRAIPVIGDVLQAVGAVQGRLAYCSFPSLENDDGGRCLFVAVDNPSLAAAGLRAVPKVLSRVAEKGEYRGRPFLHVRGPLPTRGGDIVIAAVDQALVITSNREVTEKMIDAIENQQTLDRLELVRRFLPLPSGRVLAEFYSAGKGADHATSATVGGFGDQPRRGLLRWLLADRRLEQLAQGPSYSLCLRQPRGIEILTCSTTGFHWSVATAGLAAIALRSLPLADLIEPDSDEDRSL